MTTLRTASVRHGTRAAYRAPLRAFARTARLLMAACVLAGTSCAATAMTEAGNTPAAPRTAPPMSRPLPAQRLPGAPTLATSCRTNADCAIKDVGNCCGHMPACVNKDSAVDPAAVQAQCAKDGRMSACGFRPVTACACTSGRCEAVDGALRVERMRRPLQGAAVEPVR